VSVNSGFWDLPAEERGAAMDAACERAGVADFWDLSAEERGEAYDRAAGHYGGEPA
jgi:hypothetical protein